jgi:hypothetical protein
MNCEKVYSDFSDYIDGNLSDTQSKLIAEHIAHCERCQTYQRLAIEGTHAYRSLPEITLPDDFYGRLEHSIFEFEEAKRLKRSLSRFRSLARNISPVVSTGVAFALFFYFLSTRSPVSRPAAEMAPVAAGASSNSVATASVQDDAFALARFLEGYAGLHFDGQFTPLARSHENVPVSVTDPAFATFVSEDPSFSPEKGWSTLESPLVHTPMGFAAIPARMERPLSRITRSQDGLLVVDVQLMSRAFVAGLRKGDVIIALDETPLEEARNLIQAISQRRNAASEVRVVRNGKLVDLKIE